MTNHSRRQFLKRSTQLTSSAALGLGLPGLLASTSAIAAPADYKALVYVFLAGGNDSFNMLAPKNAGVLRNRYQQARRGVALPAGRMIGISASTQPKIADGIKYNGFGLHPECRNMANLFRDGDLGFICNLGNMVEPTGKDDYRNNRVQVPPQLFSHDSQQRQYQSEPTSSLRFGWGGGIAKSIEGRNPDGSISPLISISGRNTFQANQDPSLNAFSLSKTGLISLKRFRGARAAMVREIMDDDQGHLMANEYRDTFRSAQRADSKVIAAFNAAKNSGVDYDGIFNRAGAGNSDIGAQLRTVAKMIGGAGTSRNRRPVFFVQMNGFDTHKDLLQDHAGLMKDLSNALKAFKDSLVRAGNFDKVLTYAGSEFGRTMTPNGSGTDHAWGGHAIVMGGMVDGGKLYGTYPNLEIGGSQDIDISNPRGRWIPTTSTSQCAAVISNWMGVPERVLPDLFPSLNNFSNPFGNSQNISFIKGGTLG